MIREILFVAAGGALGTVSRFLISKYLQRCFDTVFPLGTMAVNIIGCLLIGIFCGIAQRNDALGANMKLFLIVGFCGGFTTFSSFMNENVSLLRTDNLLYSALYTGGSVVLGFVAVLGGMQLIKAI